MLRAVESEHREEREPTKPRGGVGQPETSSVASGASALVLGYIDGRAQEADMASRVADLMTLVLELQARLTKLEGADRRAAELEREVERLKAHNEKLVARIRELEIGFRRFVSERVPPEQLKLALEASALAATESVEAGSAAESSAPEAGVEKAPDPASPSPAQTVSTPPSGSGGSDPKAERKKNRHNHGRRRQTTVPKLIVEIVPAEVERLGMESFERIGHEDSSTLGHRRGGPIELVTRRGKYVPIVPSSKATTVATDGVQVPAALPPPPDATAPNSEDAVAVVLHEVATVPADPASKSNPFVDGAIVYYAPKLPVDSSAASPVQIAPVPERPIHGGLVDASLLAHLFVHKFDYHTPYYRQEIEARRQGCPNSGSSRPEAC
jgi:hypothetical protein